MSPSRGPVGGMSPSRGPRREDTPPTDGGVAAVLRRLSEKVQGVTVVDVGGEWGANLTVDRRR